MKSNQLLLFDGQTAETLPSIQSLRKLATEFESLRTFSRRSIDRLRGTIAKVPSNYRRQLPAFNDLSELVAAVETATPPNPALSSALLSIAQLGHTIVHLELNPRLLDTSPAGPAILGLCTGLLPAALCSCCRSLSEVLSFSDEVVHLAFQVGFVAWRRSENLERSTQSWSTLVIDFIAQDAHGVLQDFNDNTRLVQSKKAYVSAENASSVTISGPPSVTSQLFQQSSQLRDRKRIPLPIFAAYHATHLKPIPFSKMVCDIDNRLLEVQVQHPLIVSPVSAGPYSGRNFSELLEEVLYDILQSPIALPFVVRGLSKILSSRATLTALGPENLTKSIKQLLHSNAVEIDESKEIINPTPSAPCLASEAIAIVGMAIRLPGSETLEDFWKVLEDGQDLHEKIRPDRFNVQTHWDPSGELRNSTLTPYGVFIDHPGWFDARLFNMSPREAAQTDPQQRLMLLATYEALEMAGYTPNGTPSINGQRIGTFIGQTSDDYREVNAGQEIDNYFITGGIRAFGPGRINYHFGWEGPSYSIDTACSSSAASIQLACSALLARECDTTVSGGANFLSNSDLFAGLSRGSFLSKTGGCKTFDHDADGYVRADAVGVVVLKRLEDAIADRDNIQAVLRGCTTNHSANAVSITHPHAETQERLFRTVLDKAGIEPYNVDYAELHGTGTQAGDATEFASVTNVLAASRPHSNPLYIGSVKPNLGHGEAASGVTSLIKAIMMLKKNIIPPHVGIKGRINEKLPPLEPLNTHIPFGKVPFFPHKQGDGKRRILVNNFDAAGGNTSCVLESPPALSIHGADPRGHHVITISGKTSRSVAENSRRLFGYLKQHPAIRLEDIAYTTTARRMHHVFRKAYVVSSIEGLIISLERALANDSWSKSATTPSVIFVFPGQGSQYVSMATELYSTNPSFRETMQDYEQISISHGFPSYMSIIDSANVELSQFTPIQAQLALVSVELAVAELWRSFNIMPCAVIGHSLGEYAALCIAGVISVSDCIYLVGKRASIFASKCAPGSRSMLALQASVETSLSLLSQLNMRSCEIACSNGPASTVISGSNDEINQLLQCSRSQGLRVTILDVQFAFHSAQMDPVLDDLEAEAKQVHFSKPVIPVASSLLGTLVEEEGIFGAPYLRRQTRQCVEFASALQALSFRYKDATVWIETGPNAICLGMIRSTLGESPTLLPSLKRDDADWKTIATSVSKAYESGFEIDWREYHRPYESSLRLLELPSYAFDLKDYWIQYEGDWAIRKGAALSTETSEANTKKLFYTSSLHRIESEINDNSGISVTFEADTWEPVLSKVLHGHLVNGARLCPSSVYAEMAFTAASYISGLSSTSQLSSQLSMDVRDMSVQKPLLIRPGGFQIIQVAAAMKNTSNTVELNFSSRDGSTIKHHADCIVTFSDGNEWTNEWSRNAYLIRGRMDQLMLASKDGRVHKILKSMVYKLFGALVDYDEKYQGLQEVYMDSKLLEATAKVRFCTTSADEIFTCSPFWIDSFAHLSGFVLNGAETTPTDTVYISHGWQSMRVVRELHATKSYQSYVRMQPSRGVMAGDVYLFENEDVVAVCTNLKFQQIKRTTLNHLIIPPHLQDHEVSLKADISSRHQFPSLSVTSSSQECSGPISHQTNTAQRRAIPVSQTKSTVPQKESKTCGVASFTKVLEIIAAEIGIHISELDDDILFEELGVDSLLTITIIAELRKQLGQEIPANVLVDHTSVKDLRSYFEGSASSPSGGVTPSEESDLDSCSSTGSESTASPILKATAILLQSSSTTQCSSLFLLPDGSGIASSHINLPPLSYHGAIYALNSPFLQNPASFTVSLESITSAFVREIRRLQPHGPYHLGGWSIGGSYAFEAASQLSQRHGAEVSSLILVDAPCPKILPPLTLETVDLLEMIGALDGLKQKAKREQQRNLTETMEVGGSQPQPQAQTPIREGVRAHFSGSIDALEAYQPEAIPMVKAPKSVTILWARNGVWENVDPSAIEKYNGERKKSAVAEANAAADWILDPRTSFGPGGWESLLPGAKIECRVIEGDHFSIMRDPCVRDLRENMGAALGVRGG